MPVPVFRPGFPHLPIISSHALALPNTVSASETDDDATIVLSTYDETYPGDSDSYCELDLEVTDNAVLFSTGDSFTVFVYEASNLSDRTIFSLQDSFTAQEVAEGMALRTIDCSSALPSDSDGGIEVYAVAQIDKDDCGFGCSDDSPTTPALLISEVTDDDLEQNDDRLTASPVAQGMLDNRLAADDDWYQFDLSAKSRVQIQLAY
jgi:hypothetical protein